MADTKISALTELTGANLAATDVFAVVDTSATTTKKVQFSGLQSAVSSFTNLIHGLETSNAADADHDITVATGRARDDADGDTLILSTAITKQIDAAWAVGTNLGGLDTGTVATDTWYYIWLIKRSDTAVVDVLFSTSATAPTMPTNYDLKRLIWAVRTDGSANIKPYYQTENWLKWRTRQSVLSAGTASTSTAVTIDPAVPSISDAFSTQHEFVISSNAGTATGSATFRVATGVDYSVIFNFNQSFGPGQGMTYNHGEYEIPYTGVFEYRRAIGGVATSGSLSVWVTGFKLTR